MSNSQPPSFIELCLAGTVAARDIDDFVDRWHEGQGNISLRDYLGMSDIEYALWINDSDVLPAILQSRRESRPFIGR